MLYLKMNIGIRIMDVHEFTFTLDFQSIIVNEAYIYQRDVSSLFSFHYSVC